MKKLAIPKELGGSYLANAIREVTEESYPLRKGMRYELVPKEVLEPFLTLDKNAFHRISDVSFQNAFTAFLEEGVESENFRQNKLPYLGTVEPCLLDIYFDQWDEFAENNRLGWYEVEIKADGRYSCIAETVLEEHPVSYRCDIEMLPEEEQQILKKMYQLVGSQEEPEKPSCNAIWQNTVINALALYYVGAALCVAIIDGANQVVGYFDMGLYSGANSSSVFVQNNSWLAQINEINILNQLQQNPNKTVIISHWHDDHINLLYSIRNNQQYQTFWQQSSFYVPNSNFQMAININQTVLAAGGTFVVMPNIAASSFTHFQINNNPNILCCKIDAFSDGHPHHHGIYTMVKLASGKLAFLAGDCTYAGVAINDRFNLYAYIQACHHGGNYAVRPAQRNINDIPLPDPAQNPTAVYSANGVTYGHPNLNFVRDHNMIGYVNHIPSYNGLLHLFQ